MTELRQRRQRVATTIRTCIHPGEWPSRRHRAAAPRAPRVVPVPRYVAGVLSATGVGAADQLHRPERKRYRPRNRRWNRRHEHLHRGAAASRSAAAYQSTAPRQSTNTDNRIRLPAGAHRASALATHQSSGSGLTRAAADDRIRPTPSAAVRRNRGSQTDEPTGDLAYEARRSCTVRVMLCRRPVESGWPSAHSRSGRSAWSAARPVAAGTPSRHRRHGERFDSERRMVDVMAICPGRARRRLPPSARPRGSERW